jgi:hypothetical protein
MRAVVASMVIAFAISLPFKDEEKLVAGDEEDCADRLGSKCSFSEAAADEVISSDDVETRIEEIVLQRPDLYSLI